MIRKDCTHFLDVLKVSVPGCAARAPRHCPDAQAYSIQTALVFSLFGKKPPPRPPKPAARKDVAADHKPAPSPQPAPKAEEPVKAEPIVRSEEADEAPLELPSLEFTVEDIPDTPTPAEISSIVLVGESTPGGSSVAEEAAMLFAHGQDELALESLEAAFAQDQTGAADEQTWWMLFDLYQALGRREAFEAKSLEYVVKFERSPPAWTATEAGPSGGSAGAPVCALSGALSATSAKQLEPAQRQLARNAWARLDLGKVREFDEAGCTMLLQFLHRAKKLKQQVIVQNAAPLITALQGKIEVGQRDDHEAWLLLLEFYQQTGQQDRFEELALNYAVTFEVSPPWWEARPRSKIVPAAGAVAAGGEAGADAYFLRGDLSSANAHLLQDVARYAATRDPVVLDLAQLRRIDFVCAGTLSNVLATAADRGKTIRLRNASSLVAVLLNVVGIGQIAAIECRKY